MEVTLASYVTINTQVVDSVMNSHDTVVATGAPFQILQVNFDVFDQPFEVDPLRICGMQ